MFYATEVLTRYYKAVFQSNEANSSYFEQIRITLASGIAEISKDHICFENVQLIANGVEELQRCNGLL